MALGYLLAQAPVLRLVLVADLVERLNLSLLLFEPRFQVLERRLKTVQLRLQPLLLFLPVSICLVALLLKRVDLVLELRLYAEPGGLLVGDLRELLQ